MDKEDGRHGWIALANSRQGWMASANGGRRNTMQVAANAGRRNTMQVAANGQRKTMWAVVRECSTTDKGTIRGHCAWMVVACIGG